MTDQYQIRYEVHVDSYNPRITSVVAYSTNEQEANGIYMQFVSDILYHLGPASILTTSKMETIFVDHTKVRIFPRAIPPSVVDDVLHWHVTCVSGAISLPPCIAISEEAAYVFFANMVWAVLAVNGAKIVNEEPGKTTFDDGTMIHRYACTRRCVDTNSLANNTGVIMKPNHSKGEI